MDTVPQTSCFIKALSDSAHPLFLYVKCEHFQAEIRNTENLQQNLLYYRSAW